MLQDAARIRVDHGGRLAGDVHTWRQNHPDGSALGAPEADDRKINIVVLVSVLRKILDLINALINSIETESGAD